MSRWTDQLRPASFRGVPFALLTGEIHAGRRIAMHEYPYRDEPWPEDMGLAPRLRNLTGFLVGDDVIAQRERMIAACEKPGAGELVHPSFGLLQVTLLQPAVFREMFDKGRYFEVSFSFVQGGERKYPLAAISARDIVWNSARAVDDASADDFFTRAQAALKQGVSTVAQAVDTAASWARRAQNLANDATNLYHMAGQLKGNFGRYFSGRLKGGFSGVGGITAGISGITGRVTGATEDIRTLIDVGARARSNVTLAAETFESAVRDLSP